MFSKLLTLFTTLSLFNSELLLQEYDLVGETPIAADFILEIISSDMIQITLIGEQNRFFGIGLGSTTMENTVAYIYHYDSSSNEYILNKWLLKNHSPHKLLGRVTNWSVTTLNGIVYVSFERPYKLPGSEFNFNKNMKSLQFITCVGDTNILQYHGINGRTFGEININQKPPPTQSPTMKPVRFGHNNNGFSNRFNNMFGNNNNNDDTRFENRNNNRFNNQNPLNNRFNNNGNNFRDNNIDNVDRFRNGIIGNDINNDRGKDMRDGNRNEFYNNGYDRLQNKRNDAGDNFRKFSFNNGNNYYNNGNAINDVQKRDGFENSDQGRNEFFGEFRNRMNDDNDHYFENNQFFKEKPRRNSYN